MLRLVQYATYWPVALVFLMVFLQPFGRSVELVVFIAAIIGLFDLSKNKNDLRQSSKFKYFSLLFLCFWIPSLISLIDAVNLNKSLTTSLGMLRFYLAGIFIISRISSQQALKALGLGIGMIALFWGLGMLFQVINGSSISNQSYLERISGLFGRHSRAGWSLIPIIALAIYSIYQVKGIRVATFLGLFLFSMVLVSGDRGAWVAIFWLTLSAFALFLIKTKNYKKCLAAILLIIATLAVSISLFEPLQNRLNFTGMALNYSQESINKASSGRLPLFKSALNIAADHWLNGVGVRGFRYAHPDYDPTGSYTLEDSQGNKIGAYHAHQIILELLTDTGLIGLLGYLIACTLLWRLLRTSFRENNYLNIACLLGCIGLLFPLNSHLALYSSYWMQVIWLLFALTYASAAYPQKQTKSE